MMVNKVKVTFEPKFGEETDGTDGEVAFPHPILDDVGRQILMLMLGRKQFGAIVKVGWNFLVPS